MALIKDGNHEAILSNIDSILSVQLNDEGAGSQGAHRLRSMSRDIASLIAIREFVEGDKPTIKMPSIKKEGK